MRFIAPSHPGEAWEAFLHGLGCRPGGLLPGQCRTQELGRFPPTN